MRKSRLWPIVAFFALAATTASATAGEASLLTERWSPAQVDAREYGTALVVGIAADPVTRKRFENKMVSHLRGRDIESTTSYSIVPDLTDPGDRSTILDRLLERKVDAIITVRVIPEDDAPEGGLTDRWSDEADRELRLRDYVKSALETADPDAKRYVVEVGLWEMVVSRSRIWAAQTDLHKAKKLRKLSGTIIQDVIDALESDRIF